MAYNINKLIEVAENEVGYLEKKSNKNLNDKTVNAGSKNWTKYGAYFGINPAAWCDMFVDWCFVQAYGREAAKELLNGFSAYTPTSANYYKKINRWSNTPQVGAQIFFKNSIRICHTGIVYKVTSTTVYTIEGNTSVGSAVIANGGGVCKKQYNRNNSRIAGYGMPNYGVENVTNTATTKPTTSTTNVRTYLMKGDKGEAVKKMQEMLIACGFSCGKYGADGDFGSGTDTALRKFQKKYGLVSDGKYGNLSKTKLLQAYSSTVNKKSIISKITGRIDTVAEVQFWLNQSYGFALDIDGIYGANTKKALVKVLQSAIGVKADGIWGSVTASHVGVLKKGSKGNAVKALQGLLICHGYTSAYLDGDFGTGTYNAVLAYQRSNGLSADACAGKNTMASLCK